MTPRTLYVAEELFSPSGRAGSQHIGTQPELVERLRAAGVEIVRLSPAAYGKVSYREGPDGLLAVVDNVGMPLSSLHVVGDHWLGLVAQGVEKPGNLGAMLRTADAAGADAVVAADPVTDWGNPNVVRASKGTLFALPVASATTTETLDWLRAGDVTLVVTTPETEVVHTDVDYRGRVAIAVGSEKHGADDDVARGSDPSGAHSDARKGKQPQRLRRCCDRPVRGCPAAGLRRAAARTSTHERLTGGRSRAPLDVCHD